MHKVQITMDFTVKDYCNKLVLKADKAWVKVIFS